jgi:DNA sulfur modification protein DndD
MKFKKASFRNFKLLRDVTIEFSMDPQRPLTVIRAENGHGKTSTLTALQWGLFGEDGLDVSARTVRLTPSDWPEGQRCDVEVSIEFSHTVYDEVSGEFVPTETFYRIIRTVAETPQGEMDFSRQAEIVNLYELTDAGADPILGPDIKIGEMLPIEMKNVFFTDGDKAMTFISPDLKKQTKQHHVRDSIRSLLGLGVLESARDDIEKSRRTFNKQGAKESGSAEIEEVYDQIEAATGELHSHTARTKQLDGQIATLQDLDSDKERKLIQALRESGDPKELGKKLEDTKEGLDAIETTMNGSKKQHQALLASEELSWGLMGSLLHRGVEHLSDLADRGVIPKASLPVLQDRLDLGVCICGTDLTKGTDERTNVENLMLTQKAVDTEMETLSALYYRARVSFQEHESAVEGQRGWVQQYDELSKQRLSQKKIVENLKREERSLEEKIKALDVDAISDLTAARDTIRADKSKKEDERTEEEIKRRECDQRLELLNSTHENLKKVGKKQDALELRLTVTQDVLSVVNNTLLRLENEYLNKVSNRMNELFLQMVGADPNTAGGVFKEAEITRSYSIRVLSMDDRILDPDHELNGASKRALTIAFIWALTEISGVIAPRVIDTPLGMMSGGVKRRVVELLSEPADQPGKEEDEPHDIAVSERQVVLFLTRQELLKVEDLVDKRAGVVLTYTNSSYYPTDVVNDPGFDQPTIVVCSCDHRQSCFTCAQVHDDQYDLSIRQT